MSKILSDSGARNSLIAGPSGRGYHFPSLYRNIEKEGSLLNAYMQKAGLRIVNIIDEGKSTDRAATYLQQPHIDALFLYSFGRHYTGKEGKISWHNDKPIIGGRFALWEGFTTPQTLAGKLNKASTDIYSQEGYSLIAVHVWSMKVKEVWDCVQRLNSNVRVVSPEEFVWLIRKNISRPALQ